MTDVVLPVKLPRELAYKLSDLSRSEGISLSEFCQKVLLSSLRGCHTKLIEFSPEALSTVEQLAIDFGCSVSEVVCSLVALGSNEELRFTLEEFKELKLHLEGSVLEFLVSEAKSVAQRSYSLDIACDNPNELEKLVIDKAIEDLGVSKAMELFLKNPSAQARTENGLPVQIFRLQSGKYLANVLGYDTECVASTAMLALLCLNSKLRFEDPVIKPLPRVFVTNDRVKEIGDYATLVADTYGNKMEFIDGKSHHHLLWCYWFFEGLKTLAGSLSAKEQKSASKLLRTAKEGHAIWEASLASPETQLKTDSSWESHMEQMSELHKLAQENGQSLV